MITDFATIVKNLKNQDQPIVTTSFTMTMDHYLYETVEVTLYQNYIILKSKKNDSIFKISFCLGLIVDVSLINSSKQEHSFPSIITFFKQDKWIELKTNKHSNQMFIWKSHLIQSLTQRGFHEKYRPIKKIGKGSYATVYMVQRQSDGKIFAAKAFSKDQAYSQFKGKQAIVKEINIMRSLDHQNVMNLLQVFQTKNSIYFIVQLIQCGSLHQRIRQPHKISLKDVKTIMKSILQGLSYLHSQNIMHRDLKPQNILFKNKELQCIIVDFGLAQYLDSKQFLYKRCGTPGFIAPQICSIKEEDIKRYDQKCDMFSLGIILHILLLKKAPFCDKNYRNTLLRNRQCNLDFTKHQYDILSVQSLNLLKSLLQKDPKKRISAKDALDHNFFYEETLSYKKKHLYKRVNTEGSQQAQEEYKQLNIQSSQINNEFQCPLLSKTQNRKNPSLLKRDSLGKFHMRENLMTENINSGTNNSICSRQSYRVRPLKKQSKIKRVDSRFKTTVKN